MLVDDYVFSYLDEYVSFIMAVQWYAMLVDWEMGKEAKEYVAGCKHVLNAYAIISGSFDGNNDICKANLRRFPDLRYGQILAVQMAHMVKHIEKGQPAARELSQVLVNFLYKNEPKFRAAYIALRRWQATSSIYSTGLHEAVSRLAEARSPDEVVVAAFKHLDKLLRHIVGVKPHELYGEELITRIFNSGTGALQLNTLQNEQQGLRNLVSGANALFRNPTAHRSLFKGDGAILAGGNSDQSLKIVAFVDVLETIVHNVYRLNLSPKVSRVLSEYADLFSTEDGETPAVNSTSDDWWLGRYATTVDVTLDYDDDSGFKWRVYGHKGDAQILRRICASLTEETGIASGVQYSDVD